MTGPGHGIHLDLKISREGITYIRYDCGRLVAVASAWTYTFLYVHLVVLV